MNTIEDAVKGYIKLPYAVAIDTEEVGGKTCYVAFHPELPGCMSQGETTDEAVESLQEARELYITSLLERGLQVPLPQTVATVRSIASGVVAVQSNAFQQVCTSKTELVWISDNSKSSLPVTQVLMKAA